MVRERPASIGDRWPQPPRLSLIEIAEHAGLDKSAAQQFASTLSILGYLEKDLSTKRYGTYLKLVELGSSLSLRTTLLTVLRQQSLIATPNGTEPWLSSDWRTLRSTASIASRVDIRSISASEEARGFRSLYSDGAEHLVIYRIKGRIAYYGDHAFWGISRVLLTSEEVGVAHLEAVGSGC